MLLLGVPQAHDKALSVAINPGYPGVRPRKGCFEVRIEGGDTVVSLTDMPRPFKKLKVRLFHRAAALPPCRPVTPQLCCAYEHQLAPSLFTPPCPLNLFAAASSRPHMPQQCPITDVGHLLRCAVCHQALVIEDLSQQVISAL